MNEQGPRPLIDGDDLGIVALTLLGVFALAVVAFGAGIAAGVFVVGYRLVAGG